MANLTNLFKFHYLTSAQYAGITTKDAASLYFIKDTGKIYRGAEDFTASVRLVDAFPETSIAQGVLYVNTATGEAKTYNGSAWTTVVRPVDDVVTENSTNLVTSGAVYDAIDAAVGGIDFSDYVTSLTWDAENTKLVLNKGAVATDINLTKVATQIDYDGSTGIITLKDAAGTALDTVNIPLDNFVASGTYDNDKKAIVLTLQNGDTVEIPATALIDIYYGGNTTTAKVTVTTVDGKETIKADVVVSTAEGNALSATADGLYVDISGKISKVASATEGDIATLTADGSVADSGKKVGGATLAETTDANTLATEAAVKAAVDALNTSIGEDYVLKTSIATDITTGTPTDDQVPSAAAVVDALSWKLYE